MYATSPPPKKRIRAMPPKTSKVHPTTGGKSPRVATPSPTPMAIVPTDTTTPMDVTPVNTTPTTPTTTPTTHPRAAKSPALWEGSAQKTTSSSYAPVDTSSVDPLSHSKV